MPFETKLVYSEPVMRQAAFGFWRRRLGIRIPVVIVAMAILLVWLVVEEAEPVLISAIAAGLAVSICLLPVVPLILYRTLMRQIREINELNGGNLRVDASTFTVSSSVASSTYDWKLVKEIWHFRDFWLLLFSKSQFVIFPMACLPDEMQAFVLERVKAAGGKVS